MDNIDTVGIHDHNYWLEYAFTAYIALALQTFAVVAYMLCSKAIPQIASHGKIKHTFIHKALWVFLAFIACLFAWYLILPLVQKDISISGDRLAELLEKLYI